MGALRRLAQDCVPESRLWMVTFEGRQTGRREVEWCTGPEDAHAVRQQLLKEEEYADVRVCQFLPPEIRRWQEAARKNVLQIVLACLHAEIQPLSVVYRRFGAMLPRPVPEPAADFAICFKDTRGNPVEVAYSSVTGKAFALVYKNNHSRARRSVWAARVFNDVTDLERERYRHG